VKTIKLHNSLGRIVMTRNAIVDLFDSFTPDSSVLLDFKNVEFISRSAAHEYIKQKVSFGSELKEVNMSKNVKAMFLLVAKQLKKVGSRNRGLIS
jgi:hypothetical protein